MFSILANFNFVTCENTPDIRYLISFLSLKVSRKWKKKGKTYITCLNKQNFLRSSFSQYCGYTTGAKVCMVWNSHRTVTMASGPISNKFDYCYFLYGWRLSNCKVWNKSVTMQGRQLYIYRTDKKNLCVKPFRNLLLTCFN